MENSKVINDFFAGILRPIVQEAVKSANPTPEEKPEKEFLTVKEVMKLCNCCHSTVYNRISAKKYTLIKHGGTTYISTAQVMANFKEPVRAQNKGLKRVRCV